VDGVVTAVGLAPRRLPVAGRRARRLALVLSDVDGVWTDAGVWYSEAGELLKRFSMRDGLGVERLRAAGLETGLVTGERSPAVARRAEKLGLRHVLQGVRDKRAAVDALLAAAALELGQVAYMGDDHNDLGLLEALRPHGLTAAPADALPAVARAVHWRSRLPGGHGAFRAFAEWLLDLREPGGARRRQKGAP
jgi:3-deoxy-D-manno-octulosonate 8-phosphate phosphatase (KDO 8-P phosphatase)